MTGIGDMTECPSKTRQFDSACDDGNGRWILSSSAGQFDVSGDDAMNVPAAAEEEPPSVVEAETFSRNGRFVVRNDGDGAANQRVVRIVFPE